MASTLGPWPSISSKRPKAGHADIGVAAAGDGHQFQARIGRDGGDVLVPGDLADADDPDPDDAHAASSPNCYAAILYYKWAR
jgi:hypothetical protein